MITFACTIYNRRNISSIIFSNSEAKASDFLKIIEEIIEEINWDMNVHNHPPKSKNYSKILKKFFLGTTWTMMLSARFKSSATNLHGTHREMINMVNTIWHAYIFDITMHVVSKTYFSEANVFRKYLQTIFLILIVVCES